MQILIAPDRLTDTEFHAASSHSKGARHGPTRPSAATIALLFFFLALFFLALFASPFKSNGQLEETIVPREYAST
jgi:hypothetical protein